MRTRRHQQVPSQPGIHLRVNASQLLLSRRLCWSVPARDVQANILGASIRSFGINKKELS